MEIGIVNLNINLERIYAIPGFAAGRVYRPENPVVQAGGKGINVACVLRALGVSSRIAGCLGGNLGRWIAQDLRQRKLSVQPFVVSGESRVCLAIYDTFRSLQTVINEPGQIITKTDAAKLRRFLDRFFSAKDAVVFAGSAVPGMTPGDYGRMVGDAIRQNVPVFVDAGGDYLRAALRHRPFLIKPNLEEWEHFCGRRLRSERNLKASVRPVLASGIAWVVVSQGRAGLLAFNGGRCFSVRVPAVKTVNAVGCGDALVAGFVKAVMDNRRSEDTVRFAAAVACAHAMTAVPGQVRPGDIRRILPEIKVRHEKLPAMRV